MDALEYLETRRKICEGKQICEGCYLEDCYEYETNNPQKAINLVQKWKEENKDTYANRLYKLLNDAEPFVIESIKERFCVREIFTSLENRIDCLKDCEVCWNKETLVENK